MAAEPSFLPTRAFGLPFPASLSLLCSSVSLSISGAQQFTYYSSCLAPLNPAHTSSTPHPQSVRASCYFMLIRSSFSSQEPCSELSPKLRHGDGLWRLGTINWPVGTALRATALPVRGHRPHQLEALPGAGTLQAQPSPRKSGGSQRTSPVLRRFPRPELLGNQPASRRVLASGRSLPAADR